MGKPVAFRTHQLRVALKALEVVLSVIFLVLTARAFAAHFYNYATSRNSRGVGVPKVEDAPRAGRGRGTPLSTRRRAIRSFG